MPENDVENTTEETVEATFEDGSEVQVRPVDIPQTWTVCGGQEEPVRLALDTAAKAVMLLRGAIERDEANGGATAVVIMSELLAGTVINTMRQLGVISEEMATEAARPKEPVKEEKADAPEA